MTQYKRVFCAVLIGLTAFSALAQASAFFEDTVILPRGRMMGAWAIPKMVTTPDASVLIVGQDRKGGDWGKRIDPFFMRSEDAGKSWSEPQLLVPEDFPQRDRSIIKPTGIVVDQETKRIFVFVSRSPLTDESGEKVHEKWFYTNIQRTRKLGRAWFLVHSDDNGKSWSAPKEITQQLMVKDHWQEWSPVHTGIQLQHGDHKGRLLVPIRCYCPETDPSEHDWKYQSNGLIYSDDHGATWRTGAKSDNALGECAIAERSDGVVYMDQRILPGRPKERWSATSKDGGLSLTPAKSTGLQDALCHVGLLATQDAEGKPILLLSSIPGPKRVGMTISLSRDGGESWTRGPVVNSGNTAYSDLCQLPDGSFLCLYETGKTTSRKDLALAHFNLAWVLQGL